jgi:hypothetical protein
MHGPLPIEDLVDPLTAVESRRASGKMMRLILKVMAG